MYARGARQAPAAQIVVVGLGFIQMRWENWILFEGMYLRTRREKMKAPFYNYIRRVAVRQ